MATTKLFVKLSGHGNPDYDEPHNMGVPTEWVQVGSFEDASRVARDFIRRWDLGGGNWSGGEIRERSKTGKVIGRVAYNGRVFESNASKSKVLYEP